MPFDVTNIYLWRLYFITDNCCESCFKRRSIGLTWGGKIYISAVKPIAPAVWWPRAWLTARNFYEWRPTYRTARRIVNRFNMGRSIYVRHWGLLALVFQLPFKLWISKCVDGLTYVYVAPFELWISKCVHGLTYVYVAPFKLWISKCVDGLTYVYVAPFELWISKCVDGLTYVYVAPFELWISKCVDGLTYVYVAPFELWISKCVHGLTYVYVAPFKLWISKCVDGLTYVYVAPFELWISKCVDGLTYVYVAPFELCAAYSHSVTASKCCGLYSNSPFYVNVCFLFCSILLP